MAKANSWSSGARSRRNAGSFIRGKALNPVRQLLLNLQLHQALTLLNQAGVALPQRKQVDEVQYLQAILNALCELTSTDPLTGLLNRRFFLPLLERELDRVSRGGELALLLCVDIDHFKRVNDTFGHLAGDLVIQKVAMALSSSVRPMDSVARMGGEEFSVLCPNCPPSFAEVVAQRLRASVERSSVAVPGHDDPIQVTVSCGGAFAAPGLAPLVQDWISRADALLYRAKADGRNCVRLEDVPTPHVSAEEKSFLFGTDASLLPTGAHPRVE